MFKPMLAKNIAIKDIQLPVFVSTKLEGVRGEFTPDGLKTRPMKKFNNRNLELFFGEVSNYVRKYNIYIEGEFYKHGLEFNEISSICRRAEHPDTDTLEFHIFDIYMPEFANASFAIRLEMMQTLVEQINHKSVKVCYQSLIYEFDTIQNMYEIAIDSNYEGLCFKSPRESYKHGRSTLDQQFTRIKQDNTYDGVVLDIVERMENLVESKPNELGMMSKTQDKDLKAPTGLAAVAVTSCEDFPEPVRVVLSKNLSDNDREEIWANREDYIGKNLRFYGIPVLGMNQPRCPRFDTWRTDLD
jgi:hypothetical protein